MVSSPTSILAATASSAAERLTTTAARHERWLVVAAVALLAALAWTWLAGGSGIGKGMAMAPPSVAQLLFMWWVMMAAMMLPSAAPAILLYARVRQQRGASAVAPSVLFVSGYLLAWLALSLIATVLQLAATRTGWIDAMTMRATSPRVAGLTLIVAGLFQFAPLKDACLAHCRSPASFFARHFRRGALGTVRLGVIHGAYCVGCCWLLMALLFVGGVMNFVWIAALVALVAAEKLARRGPLVGRLIGAALVAWGVTEIAL